MVSIEAERYADEYQAALKQVIEAKVEGAPLPEAPAARAETVVDLMEALRASIEATKKKKPSTLASKPVSASRNGSHRRRKSA
jgi:DNA end-binding protein Ku